jgi:hypothetical protein
MLDSAEAPQAGSGPESPTFAGSATATDVPAYLCPFCHDPWRPLTQRSESLSSASRSAATPYWTPGA